MNELEFFSAWPLKLLMVLLVSNLAVVTWTRIPFTPPRYGVWMIHVGIIVLIGGMALYYGNKIEGLTRIPVGSTIDHFYDTFQRALYVKVDGQIAGWHELRGLPRFHDYPDAEGRLSRVGEFEPFVVVRDEDGEAVEKPLAQAFQWDQPLTARITGYWPYATIESNFEPSPGADAVAIRLRLPGDAGHNHAPDEVVDHPHTEQVAWLMGGDAGFRTRMLGDAELEHRPVAAGQTARLVAAAGSIHGLEFTVGDASGTLVVEPGKSYDLGTTGYRITVESFDPAWRTMKGDVVQLLTFLVESPTLKYRRQLIAGRDAPTDWKLDEPGAGPMGKRQTEPLDPALTTVYRFADPQLLTPSQGDRKYTLLTEPAGGLTVIEAGLSSPLVVTPMPEGSGGIEIHAAASAPFMPAGHPPAPPLTVAVERVDGVRRVEQAVPVPARDRDRATGQAGVMQVVRVELKKGDWTHTAYVPFAQWTIESPWEGSPIEIPGTATTIQLQTGDLWRPLPTQVTLDKFDLVPYAGGDTSRNSMFRDFRSTLQVKDPLGRGDFTATAAMNNPVYIDTPSGLPKIGATWPFTQSWLLFQAQWDAGSPTGAPRWTVLGVGNRPGVWVMTAGCALMCVGLLWAFYLKPVLIRRAKQRAIAAAEARGGAKPAPSRPGRSPATGVAVS